MSDTTDRPQAATAESVSTGVASGPSGKSLALAKNDSSLVGERGKTAISDIVVAKIAGIATREIDGVHDVGGATERVVGKVRDVLPGTTTSTTQGINVEVGELQAAVDVSIVADYGVAIHQLAAAIRRNVIAAIEQMTGLEVTEVNVTVHDIHFGDDDESVDEEPRVQ
ncbi:Asp23/Gls24 family envelope stress response protein [Gordonia sp. DT218]|uniref:Asp23/Gls24 family envelope stress response protein n=1 Tax=unclassified Gordonia (in: high G+C Gram-positive bacteria) TaxID=2657482 RepID=UPI003CF58D16